MLGISIYLYEKPNKTYIEHMSTIGFKEVFSSIHIPEYSFEDMWDNLIELGVICKSNGMHLIVDISQNMVSKLPVALADLAELGVTGIRLDDGFTMEDAAKLSKVYKIALNASTLSKVELNELNLFGADFEQIEAWHNYYPRIFTGLDEDYFLQQNAMLKEKNIKVAAFVMGDGELRGPMYEGLPTLEMHRNDQVFANALELMHTYFVDTVLIGDSIVSEVAQHQFEQYFVNDALPFRVKMKQPFEPLFSRAYHNRPEVARDVVRIVESRALFAKHDLTGQSTIRFRGDITINMQALVRYSGEIQLVKKPLPDDPYVITIGKIIEQDIALLNYCGGSQKIQLEDFTHGFRKIND